MTHDELEDFLKDSIVPKLEKAFDLEVSGDREEERSQGLEWAREARKKADKDAEIEMLKMALANVFK